MAADVVGGSAWLVVQLEAGALGDLGKVWLLKRRCQALEEPLIRRAEVVVDVVTGGPERVATSAGQLNEPQARVISGGGLKGDVGVPELIVPPGDDDAVVLRLAVELCVLLGADGADLEVVAAKLALRIEQRVDVQRGAGRTTRQLSKPEDELLLEIIREVVLGAEEDDAALGDCSNRFRMASPSPRFSKGGNPLVMARSRISSSESGASSHSTRLAVGNSRPMAGVTSKCS